MQDPAHFLVEKGFRKESALNHHELVGFILPWIYRRNAVMISFLLLLATFLGLVIYGFVSFLNSVNSGFGDTLTAVGAGLGFSFLLIPIHELIHGAAYKLSGAPSVQFRANWKQLYFMALAHYFVVGKKQFTFIGLSPFLIISTALIVMAFMTTGFWQLTLLSVNFFHATMCIGDFALMSYFESNSDREWVTFDDTLNNISYFYSRPITGSSD